MSKQEKASPSDAQETSVESPSGVSNTKERLMSPLDLLKVNVNAHTEKKNGLTYLSWAWAWAEALKADPQATFQVHTFGEKPYMDVNGTGMVWVSVIMFNQGRTCMLPVMDHRNKPIQSPDAFQVNTAIMRCMTKTLALHGLGLYIYSGDDLPEDFGGTSSMGDLIKKEDAPAYAPIAEKAERSKEGAAVVTVVTQEAQADVEIKDYYRGHDNKVDGNAQLFADGMTKFLEICKNKSGLNSYWKANQEQLDKLKVSHPEFYAQVRNSFAEKKKSFTEEETK